MRLKLFIQSFVALPILLIPIFVSAHTVPWSSQTYYVLARSGEDLLPGGLYAEDTDSSSAPPVSAYAEYLPDYGPYASSEITATTMNMDCSYGLPARRCQMIASFSGNYLANDPYFLFSYYALGFWNVTVEDITTSTTLYSQTLTSGSSNLLIPTTIGDEINVSFGQNTGEICCNGEWHTSLDYNMSVVPEPISSALFIIGGATLFGRRYFRREKIA